MNDSVFDCHHFLSLDDDAVIQYTEPFLTAQAYTVPLSAYGILASELNQMSDVQKVYALELCMRHAPEQFASKALEYLSYKDSTVCCTASRLLDTFLPETVSRSLIKQISETPVVELFARHVRTGENVRIGTNEEFIRRLFDRFDIRAKGE